MAGPAIRRSESKAAGSGDAALTGGNAPARMYLDDQESYASNENAINWSAALVFTLAGVLPGN